METHTTNLARSTENVGAVSLDCEIPLLLTYVKEKVLDEVGGEELCCRWQQGTQQVKIWGICKKKIQCDVLGSFMGHIAFDGSVEGGYRQVCGQWVDGGADYSEHQTERCHESEVRAGHWTGSLVHWLRSRTTLMPSLSGVTRGSLQQILGAWNFAPSFRREALCCLDVAFVCQKATARYRYCPLLHADLRTQPPRAASGACIAKVTPDQWSSLCRIAEE